MSKKIYNISISEVYQGGKLCTDYSVFYENVEGLLIPCVLEGNTIKVELNEESFVNCIDIVVQCNTCAKCPPKIFKYCFCDDNNGCRDCQTCSDGLCVDTCTDGQHCLNGNTCVNCTDNSHCSDGKVCLNGECVCPASAPYENAQGICVACLPTTTPPACQTCVGGVFVPTDCGTEYCLNNVCVECINSGHCTGANQTCVNNTCQCSNGYVLNPQTGLCELAPECVFDQDCGACETCVSGECQPLVCPTGQTCVNGVCYTPCTTEAECPAGYGCLNGVCVPCSSLDCDPTTDCTLANGCGCIDGSCSDTTDQCNTTLAGVEWNYVPPSGTNSGGLPPLQIHRLAQNGFTGSKMYMFIINNIQGTFYYSPALNVEVQIPTYSSPPPGINNNSTFYTVVETGITPLNGNQSPFWLVFKANDGREARVLFEPTTTPSGGINWMPTDIVNPGLPPTNTVPGYWQLCSTNSLFMLTQPFIENGQGDLVITPTGVDGSCVNVHIEGCGDWTGEAVLSCFGNTVNVPINFQVDPITCCDAQSPTCDAGPEDCTQQTVTGTISLTPLYENDQYIITANFPTVPATELYTLDPTNWEVTNPSFSDIVLQPSGSGTLSQLMTSTRGGCVEFTGSNTCYNLIAEQCWTTCDLFSLQTVQNSEFVFTVTPSLTTSLTWTIIQNADRVPAGLVYNQDGSVTFTIDPSVNNNGDVVVQAAYTASCVRTTSVSAQRTPIGGCTDTNACNYDPNAEVDNGTCEYLPSISPLVGCVVLGSSVVLQVPGLQPNDTITVGNPPRNGATVTVDNFNDTISYSPSGTLTNGSVIFNYTVTNSCGSVSSYVSIHLVSSGEIEDIYYCSGVSTIQLSDLLENEATGVTYQYGTCSAETSAVPGLALNGNTGQLDIDTSIANQGFYQLTVKDTQAGNGVFADCNDCTDISLIEQTVTVDTNNEVCSRENVQTNLNNFVTTNSPSSLNVWTNNNCQNNASNPQVLTVTPTGGVDFFNAASGTYTFSFTAPCGNCYNVEVDVYGSNVVNNYDILTCENGTLTFQATFPNLSSGTTATILINNVLVPASDYTINTTTGVIAGSTTVGVSTTQLNTISIQPHTICAGDGGSGFRLVGTTPCST